MEISSTRTTATGTDVIGINFFVAGYIQSATGLTLLHYLILITSDGCAIDMAESLFFICGVPTTNFAVKKVHTHHVVRSSQIEMMFSVLKKLVVLS